MFEFKQELERQLPGELVKLELFGSKARGEAYPESDTDVLLVLQDASEDKTDIVYDIVTRLLVKHGLYLSVKVFALDEYDRLSKIPTMFMRSVKREAVTV